MSVTNFNVANVNINSFAPEPVKEVKIEKRLTTEEYVRKYFSDKPILAEVARCESRFRQVDKKGETLTGAVNEFDKGVMQINEYYHGDRAEALGLDIHTLEGNAKYARFLFEKEGLRPWNSSSKCWKQTQAYRDYADGVHLLAINQ
jgi:hypothetical protein